MKTQKQTLLLAVFALFAFLATPAMAQRGGGRGEGGGFGGDRGGFRGGGPPGGGGFRGGGGPPGSSFGGDRGSRGGPSGGFDPSGFLSRLDRNGNGKIDPDEQEGPAQFLIRRLQSVDPSIKPGEPISIKRVTESFQKMRGQREGGDNSSTSRRSSSSSDDALTPELLVPGFGRDEEPAPLMGFGATAEMLSVSVTEADLRQARETIRRYDRNRDGVLTKDELSSRFSGNPMDFDRNKDGRLTEKEMAVRYARRREVNEEARSDDRSRRDRGRNDDRDVDPPNVYNGRKSYRAIAGPELPEGVPGFFSDKDKNQDGQVTMGEFASEWDDATVQDFFKSDLNRDGVITAREAVRAIEEASNVSSAPSSTGSASSSRPTSSGSSSGEKPTEKYLAYAKRILSRADKNEDNKLTPSEWKGMLINPADADSNRDGSITIEEYALWMQSRSKRK